MEFFKYKNTKGEYHLKKDGDSIQFVHIYSNGEAKISDCHYMQNDMIKNNELVLDQSNEIEFALKHKQAKAIQNGTT